MSLAARFGLPLRFHSDTEAAHGGEHARRTGRSWWALLKTDGTIIHEWDPDKSSPNGHMDWPRLAMLGKLRHTRALRLYCPDGRMAELGGEGDQTGLLFQFKVAVRYVATSASALSHEMLGHVVGQITGHDGQCRLFVWEPAPVPLAPNPDDFLKAEPGTLSRAYDEWRALFRAWQQSGGGALVGPLEDNVYDLAYQQVGRLSADHLGIVEGEGR